MLGLSWQESPLPNPVLSPSPSLFLSSLPTPPTPLLCFNDKDVEHEQWTIAKLKGGGERSLTAGAPFLYTAHH